MQPNAASKKAQQWKISVGVRSRPLLASEEARGEKSVVRCDGGTKVVVWDPSDEGVDLSVDVLHRSAERHYNFPLVFGPDASQLEVWRPTVKPLVEFVLSGCNASVFAYGCTGSGKTHTMVGSAEKPGTMVLTLEHLFERMKSNPGAQMKAKMSYLEIYNETIRDLLSPSSKKLALRESQDTGVTVSGLSEFEATSAKQVMEVLAKGNECRTVEATAANEASSRSHAILQVIVSQTAGGNMQKMSKLCMVDLAGSERASATKNRGIRLTEGANINRSLLSLANCINALFAAAKYKRDRVHIPYRDSKLTRLLKDSLGGNCRTVMIATLNPLGKMFEESLNTLKYASRASNITTNVKVVLRPLPKPPKPPPEVPAPVAAGRRGGQALGQEQGQGQGAGQEQAHGQGRGGGSGSNAAHGGRNNQLQPLGRQAVLSSRPGQHSFASGKSAAAAKTDRGKGRGQEEQQRQQGVLVNQVNELQGRIMKLESLNDDLVSRHQSELREKNAFISALQSKLSFKDDTKGSSKISSKISSKGVSPQRESPAKTGQTGQTGHGETSNTSNPMYKGMYDQRTAVVDGQVAGQDHDRRLSPFGRGPVRTEGGPFARQRLQNVGAGGSGSVSPAVSLSPESSRRLAADAGGGVGGGRAGPASDDISANWSNIPALAEAAADDRIDGVARRIVVREDSPQGERGRAPGRNGKGGKSDFGVRGVGAGGAAIPWARRAVVPAEDLEQFIMRDVHHPVQHGRHPLQNIRGKHPKVVTGMKSGVKPGMKSVMKGPSMAIDGKAGGGKGGGVFGREMAERRAGHGGGEPVPRKRPLPGLSYGGNYGGAGGGYGGGGGYGEGNNAGGNYGYGDYGVDGAGRGNAAIGNNGGKDGYGAPLQQPAAGGIGVVAGVNRNRAAAKFVGGRPLPARGGLAKERVSKGLASRVRTSFRSFPTAFQGGANQGADQGGGGARKRGQRRAASKYRV